jgi:hypothetical protein
MAHQLYCYRYLYRHCIMPVSLCYLAYDTLLTYALGDICIDFILCLASMLLTTSLSQLRATYQSLGSGNYNLPLLPVFRLVGKFSH